MSIKSKRKKICASVLCCSKINDPRPFLVVDIAGDEVEGLLDSGASISCLGNGALDWLSKIGLHWTRFRSSVKTADGNAQLVLGHLDVPIKYGDISKIVRVYIVPGLYLEIDFWNTFGIVPMSVNGLSGELDEEEPESKLHDLDSDQRIELENVCKNFPSFTFEGLGKTSLHTHQIDTGDKLPIKQRHYPIAVQHLTDTEIERMFEIRSYRGI